MWKEKILKLLADIWLIALFFFSGGAFARILETRNFYIQVLIPIWFDSNFAVSIIIATVFYFFVWKYDRINAIAWFLFYDATFQYTLSGYAQVDATTIIFFLFSVLLFRITNKKIPRTWILAVIWSLLTLVDIFTGSTFEYQVIWASTIVVLLKY